MARFRLKSRGAGARAGAGGRRGKLAMPMVTHPCVFIPHVPSITEDSQAAVHQLAGHKVWDSVEELNGYLRSLMESGEINRAMNAPDTPKQQARQIAGEALRTNNLEASRQIADQALAIDPECVDALLAQTEFGEDASIPRYQEIVEIGRRQLDPELFEKQRGNFWGIHETRPFLRALQHLAVTCLWREKFDEAIAACEEIIDLNHADNLGVREILLTLYLRLRQREKCAALIARFPLVESAAWNWGVFLYESLYGTEASRRASLGDAMRANSHAVMRVLGMENVDGLHAEAAAGSIDEADNAALLLARAVETGPEEMMGWLVEHIKETMDQKQGGGGKGSGPL